MAEIRKYLLFSSQEESLKVVPVGEKKRVKAGGVNVCLVQTKTGLIAFRDECPHMSVSLASGALNYSNEIVCQWHGYAFSLINGHETLNRCGKLQFVTIFNIEGKYYLEF